ncbi:phage holin family protein [Paucihalobacter ruber]|uniref:Phage holin family protein n=1 Tax=Paucihalobacter ruber TaxID=2567861 RepID=A0A506PPL3_9FLAO|nr:phage holin family protein [Paucihalobacter ruber]TPV35813.1 phage holin family protein [Paucihalobacter ruber]
MKLIVKFILSAIAVVLISKLLPGVTVVDYFTALLVAVVLAILDLFVRPLLILLTLPATILTLGLFLLVINGLIILLADYLVTGFTVSSIWTAMLFSILLTILQSIFYSVLREDKVVTDRQ